jgi:moderate conductance mechanosensitive channel
MIAQNLRATRSSALRCSDSPHLRPTSVTGLPGGGTTRILALFLLLFAAPAAFAQPATQQRADEPGGRGADVKTLIRILEDNEARADLIDKLRSATAAQRSDEPSRVAASEQTIVHQIAEYTRSAVEESAGLIGALIGFGGQAAAVVSGAAAVDMPALWNAVRNIIFVVAVTFAVFFVLELGFRRFQRVLASAATRSSVIRWVGTIGISAAADAVTVIAAWGVGYLSAFYIGKVGHVGISQTLFLNAFLLIELIKVAARVLLAPRWPALRFGRIDDTTAAYWYFWLSRIVSVVGYAFLFVAPILATNVSIEAAGALHIVVLFCLLATACVIILQNRDTVRTWLTRRAEKEQPDSLGRSMTGLAELWHVVAIGYLILIFILWLADRETSLPFVLAATVQSLLAIAVGVILTAAVVRLAASGMHLPADIKGRLPLLEQRLNAFVPNVLRVVRAIVIVAVVLAIAQVWRVADFLGWLSSEFGQRVVTSAISANLILLVGGLIYLAVHSWVEYQLNPEYGSVPTPRERTLLALFRNAFTIALAVLVVLLVLAELGVNIAPLLAGAGILGLAVGFGAQKLVQDIINGAFIQFENAMNEGDVVTVGGITGSVERLTIRSVSLRTLDGAYHLIPFSSVNSVTNFTKNFSFHVATLGVAYRENIPEVKQAMQDAFDKLKQTTYGEHIMDDLEIQGVTEFGDSGIIVRARIKTTPGQQWGLGRLYNEIIKEVFDQRGIYMGGDKQSNSPLLRIEPRQAELGATPAKKTRKRSVAARNGLVETPTQYVGAR